MRVLTTRRVSILGLLLSEADFFVDGKDLQTFSAISKSRFFLPAISLMNYRRVSGQMLASSAASSGAVSSSTSGFMIDQSSIT
jgi:hypothetical protein